MKYPDFRSAVVGLAEGAYECGANGRAIDAVDIDDWVERLKRYEFPYERHSKRPSLSDAEPFAQVGWSVQCCHLGCWRRLAGSSETPRPAAHHGITPV